MNSDDARAQIQRRIIPAFWSFSPDRKLFPSLSGPRAGKKRRVTSDTGANRVGVTQL